MDIKDQLGSMRAGEMSRRAFTKSLLAAGVAVATMPTASRKAAAAAEDQATFFTWGGL